MGWLETRGGVWHALPNLYTTLSGKLMNVWVCTDSRPRARWYQLRGLPLVGSDCVCPQRNSSFVITRGSTKEKKWNSRHSKFSNRQMSNGTTAAVQHPPKAHLGLPTTSWLRPSSFLINLAVRTLGNDCVQQNRAQSYHDLRSITATDVQYHGMIYTSRALTDPTSCKHAPRVTPPIAHATCRKTDHTRNVYSSTIATSKTSASTPNKLCPYTTSAMNRQLLLRQALSALTQKLQVTKTRTRKSATQNLEFLPKSQYLSLIHI